VIYQHLSDIVNMFDVLIRDFTPVVNLPVWWH